MTNFEKYKDKILKTVGRDGYSFGKKDNEIIPCKSMKNCSINCDFFGDCTLLRYNWLYDESDEGRCVKCVYASKSENEYPCNKCCYSFDDLFAPREKETRQDKFLSLFSDAFVEGDGIINLKPCVVSPSWKEKKCKTFCDCYSCRRGYWFGEITC